MNKSSFEVFRNNNNNNDNCYNKEVLGPKTLRTIGLGVIPIGPSGGTHMAFNFSKVTFQ